MQTPSFLPCTSSTPAFRITTFPLVHTTTLGVRFLSQISQRALTALQSPSYIAHFITAVMSEIDSSNRKGGSKVVLRLCSRPLSSLLADQQVSREARWFHPSGLPTSSNLPPSVAASRVSNHLQEDS